MKSLDLKKILVPVLAVLFGFAFGAIIMLIFGYNPIWGYEDLLNSAFGSTRSIGEVFRTMGPLILTALSFAVASQAGLFNIGMSGQALCGWVASIWFALSFPDIPRLFMIPLLVIVGMIAGALSAAIPGILKAYLGTSEVIVTIMLNYVYLFISTYLIHYIFKPKILAEKDSTIQVSKNATFRTSWLSSLTNNSRLNIGIFIAIIAIIVIYILITKTTLGFEIRSVGLNPYASEYAGMSSKRIVVSSMLIAGALSGLGGAVEGLGTFQNFFVQPTSLSIGFDGMAVALLGQNSPLGILFSSFLFSILKVGAPGMNKTGIPPEIVSVVIASIIFFVGIKYVIEKIVPDFKKKGGKA
ncbi:ABC transporter permease [Floricoccus penangensis]|uniref:Branched-chain amino acid ABC transporter permease n=1 Tax=Floricoccus penangensis TaxID=1859475 RepID=A0A9Q5JEU6_9LACT|nr:ABC transporter permease [Floricoccus penangensis]OFI46024.1 branched-chain amino acid ABC transporter permease [Floricoccus penangensis]URZ86503.1 ABC transporter permease [Floricoccus penangensis]